MVSGRTLSSRRTTPSPERWLMPKTGGVSVTLVPRPCAPLKRRRRGGRPASATLVRLALVARDHSGLVARHGARPRHRVCFGDSPSRRQSALACTSSLCRSNACAIWTLDSCKPMKERHSTPVDSGGWWPDRAVPVRSSQRLPHDGHSQRWRRPSGPSTPRRIVAWLSPCGQKTPAGHQRPADGRVAWRLADQRLD